MCVLRVSSNSSAFEAFLADTRLPIYETHKRGDVRHVRKCTFREDFGFSCDVSSRNWDDLPGQVADAITFLTTYSNELRRLRSGTSVDDIRLDFPVECQLSENVLGQYQYLPPELLRLCGEHGIGIELSQYARDWNTNCEPAAGGNAE